MALDEIRKVKIEKVKKLREVGIDPYPAVSKRTHSIKKALDDFDSLSASGKEIVLAGRVMAKREQGGLIFFDLNDPNKIQGLAKEDVLGGKFKQFQEFADIGDFIEVRGALFKTKREEKTIEIKDWKLLTKALLPLPEKWHGLKDVEERFRKRYLDLLLNEDVQKKFTLRSKIIAALRSFMERSDFLEVDTPALQLVAGGAMAKPFKTHLNALDIDVYLRIAPELHLKRLLVGGFERVYEFSRNFRNEGMDRDHNPEFSELEFYAAYKDYRWLMDFTEEMLENVVTAVFDKPSIIYKEWEINFKAPYKRVKFNDILKEYANIDYDEADERGLVKKAEELGIEINKTMTKGIVADEIYKKIARPNIIQPTYIIDHPIEISPLAKRLDKEPSHVARMQLIVAGHEIINAYSELNDPLDQRERFEAQQETAKRGNEEAHPFDEEFIEALEYGMPPAAGWGMGIDRLVTILTNSHSIREVILFPLMRPK